MDHRFSEILGGSAWALGARILATVMSMVSSIIVARFYGAEIMGILTILTSFLIMANIFTVLGTNTSILKLIPKHLIKYSATSAFRVYRKTQFIVILVSFLVAIIVFFCSSLVASKLFSKEHLSFYFSLAAVFITFKSVMLLNTSAVRGLRLIKTFAFMQALPAFSNLFLLFLLTICVYTKNNPIYTYLAGLSVTAITGWIIMEYSFRKRMGPHDYVKNVSARSILKVSLPMFMTSAMSFVIGHTGVIILGIYRTEIEVGYFSIALKLALLTGFILQSINSMAAPKFSELYHSGKMADLFYVAKKSTKLIFWATMPVLLILCLFGKHIIWLLYGEEFTVAYLPLVVMVLGQFFNSVSGSTGFFMNMTDHEKVFRNIILSAAIINIILNILLIPTLGIMGAAFGALVSTVFWNGSTLIYIKRKYGQTIGYFPLPRGRR